MNAVVGRSPLDDRDRAADGRRRDAAAVRRERERDDRRRADLDLGPGLAVGGENAQPAIGAAGDDLAVRRHRDGVERRRQGDDRGRALVGREDAQRRVVARRHEPPAGSEGDAVDVALVAVEHPRRPIARKRAHARGAIPRGRGDRAPVGRDGERDDRPFMRLDHPNRRSLARLPQRDAAVLAPGGEAPVGERRRGVHGAVMEAQHGERRPLIQGPQDRRLVEASRQREPPVRRYRDRPHRPAMAAELRQRGRCEGEEGDADGANEHPSV